MCESTMEVLRGKLQWARQRESLMDLLSQYTKPSMQHDLEAALRRIDILLDAALMDSINASLKISKGMRL